MRLICTLQDLRKAEALSSTLHAHHIDNQLESHKDSDWGSHTYGDVEYLIWIVDEDLVEEAKQCLNEFESTYDENALKEPHHLPPPPFMAAPDAKKNTAPTRSSKAVDPLGTITSAILLLCCVLFALTSLTDPPFTSYPASLPAMPLFSSPLKKALLYDYPKAYEIIDKLVKLYGIELLQTPQHLPPEGKALLAKLHQTPYWQGYYDILLRNLRADPPAHELQAPMFEKIKQGEGWRLISPCFLHSDLLHIFFNMVWLVILGKQLEKRLRPRRYLLFIFLTGIISNTAQYLMSGSNFIGFSGVVCGMLAFIWVRQKSAPWEGYQLDKSNTIFVGFFILSMLFLQLLSFYFEANNQAPISPGIANTAHLVGAAAGYVLGKFPFFNWKA